MAGNLRIEGTTTVWEDTKTEGNGSKSKTEVRVGGDGSITRNRSWHDDAADADVNHTVLPDGTTVQDRRFKDGSNTMTTTHPDKSVEVARNTYDPTTQSGMSEISYSDGTRHVVTTAQDADGTTRMTTVGRDGSKSETTSRTDTQADGTVVSKSESSDGTITTQTTRPNGNIESEQRFANGEVERTTNDKLADETTRSTHTARDGKVTTDEDRYDEATKTRTSTTTDSDGVRAHDDDHHESGCRRHDDDDDDVSSRREYERRTARRFVGDNESERGRDIRPQRDAATKRRLDVADVHRQQRPSGREHDVEERRRLGDDNHDRQRRRQSHAHRAARRPNVVGDESHRRQ